MTLTFSGKKLRKIREANGIKQIQLAQAVGIGQSLLSKYERGDVSAPPYSTIERMAEYLRVRPDDFYDAAFGKPGAPQSTKREQTAAEAVKLILGDRADDYGDARANFGRIAARWSQILGIEITEWQVCHMMIDLKMSRLCQVYKHDSAVDIIGYAALMSELAEDDGS